MDFQPGQTYDLRDALFGTVHELARQDRQMVFITADMGAWALDQFRRELPDQFINIGIAEQTMVDMAAGLALAGKRVFVYAIAPFLALRCLEHIKLAICGMKLPVVLIGGGPGLTYASDGMTHHALEDVAALRALPHLKIYGPGDPVSTAAVVRMAYADNGPSYLRMDKGAQPARHAATTDFTRGAAPLRSGTDLVLITNGALIPNALAVADALAADGVQVGVLDVFRLSPLDPEVLLPYLRAARAVVTYEENFRNGGIGTAVAEILADAGLCVPFRRLGVDHSYCFRYGDRAWFWQHYGLDVPTVVQQLREMLR